jgi:anaerobic selenocysteine-containing dehydrogenase
MNKEIEKSEVVILWGVDESADSLIKDLETKQVIVINPVETSHTKFADLHIKVKKQGDVFLAMMLNRFLFISDMVDIDFVQKYASEYEEFYELTQQFRIVLTLEKIGLDTMSIKNILDLVDKKKVCIICGAGVQKYEESDDSKNVINAFGILLGLFEKEGSGVLHLNKQSYEQGFDLESGQFEFVQEIDTDILKEM